MQENCRICLLSDGDNYCYLTNVRNGETLSGILAFVGGIEMEFGDGFPQKICTTCMDQLLSASEFKRKILESETFLVDARMKSEASSQNVLPTEFSNFMTENCEFESEVEENVKHPPKEVMKKPGKPRRSLKPTANRNDLRPTHDSTERKNKVPNEMDYKCFICDQMFERISTKNSHVKAEHEKERICKICQIKCKTPLSLETHLKFHFRDYSFMCEICSKTFRYQNRLNGHMALHHSKVIEMSCDICGLSTKFKNNIKRHMKSVHMKLREFQCGQCSGHNYSTQEALNSHLYRYHNAPAPIHCADCQHGFTFDSELRAHKKHGFCSKSVNAALTRRGMTRYDHWELMDETGEHVCKLCNEVFPTKNKWSMHNYLKHKYSNKCDTCNVSFTNYTSLIRHRKVKHQGHKPFKCEFCFKSFGQKVSLISHRNTHTGEKTFGCLYCTFRSGDHGTVSKHKKKMHPDRLVSTSKALV